MAYTSRYHVYIAISLDGYVARDNGDVDWLFTDQDYGYENFYRSVDTLIMGRHTYDQVLTIGAYPYEGKETYVLTTSRQGRDDYVTYIPDMASLSAKLGDKERQVWIVGGAQIIGRMLEEGWVDELRLFIHPILLGGGIPLFPQHHTMRTYHLLGTYSYSSGLVELHYSRS